MRLDAESMIRVVKRVWIDRRIGKWTSLVRQLPLCRCGRLGVAGLKRGDARIACWCFYRPVRVEGMLMWSSLRKKEHSLPSSLALNRSLTPCKLSCIMVANGMSDLYS